jgi:hypothetical protein
MNSLVLCIDPKVPARNNNEGGGKKDNLFLGGFNYLNNYCENVFNTINNPTDRHE